jgi:hypothetical protein
MIDKIIESKITPINLDLVQLPKKPNRLRNDNLYLSSLASKETEQTKKRKNSRKGISNIDKEYEAKTVQMKMKTT